MGAEDVRRQSLNVYRMKLLGAEVQPVESGSQNPQRCHERGLRDWVTNVDDTFYIIGTVAGPHPYPKLVRDFQSVIGRETRRQCLDRTQAPSGCGRGLCGRRFQCHRHVLPVPDR